VTDNGVVQGALKGWWSIVKRQVEMKKARDVAINYVTPMPDGKVLEQVRRLVEEGAIRPDVHRVFELAQLAEAHALLESGEAHGKVVVQVVSPAASGQ
jgi:NADPH:quinone reductase-like Zn-dependent oxidoreductase